MPGFTVYTREMPRESTDKSVKIDDFVLLTKFLKTNLIDAMESLNNAEQLELELAVKQLSDSIEEYIEA